VHDDIALAGLPLRLDPSVVHVTKSLSMLLDLLPGLRMTAQNKKSYLATKVTGSCRPPTSWSISTLVLSAVDGGTRNTRL